MGNNKMKEIIDSIMVRQAVAEDAAAITALLYDAFLPYRSLYTEKGFAATTLPQEEIEGRISKHVVWVAVSRNKIIGTVSIFPRYEELFVRSMAVSPAAQGNGVGKMLMEHVHEIAVTEGSSFITLTTTPFLFQAIKLYERSGFNQQGMGHLYGTPLIKMNKQLEPAVKNKKADLITKP
jgi:GNAT superfamily N-acetyltransferase